MYKLIVNMYTEREGERETETDRERERDREREGERGDGNHGQKTTCGYKVRAGAEWAKSRKKNSNVENVIVYEEAWHYSIT